MNAKHPLVRAATLLFAGSALVVLVARAAGGCSSDKPQPTSANAAATPSEAYMPATKAAPVIPQAQPAASK